MNIKYRFEKYTKNNIALSIVMVALGLILFLWPGKTLELAAKILGIALLVGAAVSVFSWYRDRHVVGRGYGTLALGGVCAIAAVVVLAAPKGVITLLPKLIGLAVLVNGLLNLAQAMDLRRMGGSSWTSSLIMAVLTVLAGLFLLLFAFSAMKAAVMVIGAIFVYNGASNLWIESRYRKAK